MRILFFVMTFTISCCVAASLIEFGFRLAMFSVLRPFSILITVSPSGIFKLFLLFSYFLASRRELFLFLHALLSPFFDWSLVLQVGWFRFFSLA